MFISTTTLTSSPSDLTAVGQKQEACSSIGLLARQSPSDRPLTTPSSTTLSMAIRQPNWSEADTLFDGYSRRERLAGHGPFERLGEGAVEVGDEGLDAGLQVLFGGEAGTP